MWKQVELSVGQRSLSMTGKWRRLCTRKSQGAEKESSGRGSSSDMGPGPSPCGDKWGGGLLSQALAADGLLTLYPSASCSALLEYGGHRGPFPQLPLVHYGWLCSQCHCCPLSHPQSPVLWCISLGSFFLSILQGRRIWCLHRLPRRTHWFAGELV